MKKALKTIAQKILPAAWYTQLIAVSARRFIEQVERERGLDVLTQRYVAACGRTVAGGPFAGMVYSPLADRRHVGARLLGTYEQEIAPAVERCCQMPYRRVIDVGCAEGYYAVGFARRLPGARVTAFDTDPWARRACTELAALNHVSDRVEVRGFCSPEGLQELLGEGRTLLVLDCEGFEAALLNPAVVAKLGACDLIVELHDAPPTSDHPLVRRLQPSHAIELIPCVPRSAHDTRPLPQFSEEEQLRMMDEMRHTWQGWAICRAQ